MAAPLEELSLQAVLASLPMPPGFETCASSWRCHMAPEVESEEAMLEYFDQGIPCFLPQGCSQPVHDMCPDAKAFVTDSRWNSFPKPKVAFVKGWAAPGTHMEDDSMHRLVTSFGEILDHKTAKAGDARVLLDVDGEADAVDVSSKPDDVLNLQFFHRADPASHPMIPALSTMLKWPHFAKHSAICDNATRVSQRGATTWWHLDDDGEFVMQTGLSNPAAGAPGTQPVKVFIYGPSASYDWFSQDAQSTDRKKVVGLDIFKKPKEHLPPTQFLPVMTVAVLRAGGRPLVSPPNIPHVVITVNDCVMVEQRRILHLFMDEVAYFMQKAQSWDAVPVVYKFVKEDMQDHEKMLKIVAVLKTEMTEGGGADAAAPAGSARRSPVWMKRVLSSLLAIGRFPEYFRTAPKVEGEPPGGGGSDDVRRDIVQHTILHGASVEFNNRLEYYWDVQTAWPSSDVFMVSPTVFCGVVYVGDTPVWGPARGTKALAAADAAAMRKHAAAGTLDEYLSPKATAHDDVLDDLF
jgi:hypothetical protein